MAPPAFAPAGARYQPIVVDPPNRPAKSAGSYRASSNVSAAPVVLLLAGIALMIGSATTWINVSLFGHSVGVAGTAAGVSGDISTVNGWFTFTGGIVLLILGGLLVVSRERSLGQIAIVIALATLGLGFYDLTRILQGISKYNGAGGGGASAKSFNFGAGMTVGYGLILVLVAGFVALLASFTAARSTN